VGERPAQPVGRGAVPAALERDHAEAVKGVRVLGILPQNGEIERLGLVQATGMVVGGGGCKVGGAGRAVCHGGFQGVLTGGCHFRSVA
jgi:hypothetical protein